VDDALHRGELKRDPVWSESVALENREFLEAFRSAAIELGHREIDGADGNCSLHEMPSPRSVGSAKTLDIERAKAGFSRKISNEI